MKKYQKLYIIDPHGKTVYEGGVKKFIEQRNLSFEDYSDYINKLKDEGYVVTTKTSYYDFEYNGEGYSKNWFSDLSDKLGISKRNKQEFLEGAVKISLPNIKMKLLYIGDDYILIVLPKQYDSIIFEEQISGCRLYENWDDYLGKLTYYIICSISKHIEYNKINRTGTPKIRCLGFIDDWRSKVKYADYNEGYTMFFNKIPDTKILEQLYKKKE